MSRVQRPVTVVGAGGHAKVVISTLRAAGFKVSLVLDDDPAKWASELMGVRVAGPVSTFGGGQPVVFAIGANAVRKKLAQMLSNAEFVTVVHPGASIDSSVQIGTGSVVFAGTVIQPDTTIGSHVIINTAATVDHDCRVSDFAHLAPGVHLAGEVQIGTGALVGIGAAVAPQRRIGDWSVIGAGSAVIGDVADGVTAAGVPAVRIEGRVR